MFNSILASISGFVTTMTRLFDMIHCVVFYCCMAHSRLIRHGRRMCARVTTDLLTDL